MITVLFNNTAKLCCLGCEMYHKSLFNCGIGMFLKLVTCSETTQNGTLSPISKYLIVWHCCHMPAASEKNVIPSLGQRLSNLWPLKFISVKVE